MRKVKKPLRKRLKLATFSYPMSGQCYLSIFSGLTEIDNLVRTHYFRKINISYPLIRDVDGKVGLNCSLLLSAHRLTEERYCVDSEILRNLETRKLQWGSHSNWFIRYQKRVIIIFDKSPIITLWQAPLNIIKIHIYQYLVCK